MRILVVDDTEDSRDLTEAALLSAGYNDVVTADSAWDALKILDVGRNADARADVDLVLLDIMMPEIDGIEACARIRNDARYVDIPIIMVTSLDDMDSLANAFVAGATDYVTKPINRVELVARVRAALKLKAELDRRQARERELLAFLSNWGDRRATLWIDENDRPVRRRSGRGLSDRRDQAPSRRHDLDPRARARPLRHLSHGAWRRGLADVLAQVAQAIRGLRATIGIIAAAYRNGMIVLVAPECGANAARALGETLCNAVSRLRLANSESIAADHVTASVAAVTGTVRTADRPRPSAHARNFQRAGGGGGGRQSGACARDLGMVARPNRERVQVVRRVACVEVQSLRWDWAWSSRFAVTRTRPAPGRYPPAADRRWSQRPAAFASRAFDASGVGRQYRATASSRCKA